jgi:hypothetical protein
MTFIHIQQEYNFNVYIILQLIILWVIHLPVTHIPVHTNLLQIKSTLGWEIFRHKRDEVVNLRYLRCAMFKGQIREVMMGWIHNSNGRQQTQETVIKKFLEECILDRRWRLHANIDEFQTDPESEWWMELMHNDVQWQTLHYWIFRLGFLVRLLRESGELMYKA